MQVLGSRKKPILGKDFTLHLLNALKHVDDFGDTSIIWIQCPYMEKNDIERDLSICQSMELHVKQRISSFAF